MTSEIMEPKPCKKLTTEQVWRVVRAGYMKRTFTKRQHSSVQKISLYSIKHTVAERMKMKCTDN